MDFFCGGGVNVCRFYWVCDVGVLSCIEKVFYEIVFFFDCFGFEFCLYVRFNCDGVRCVRC